MRISFCLITLNEEARLPRCLGSCAVVADEVVVVDSGSTDGTEQVARSFGARWYRQDWPGYVEQKNHALRLASNPWVFSIDADEELSPYLAEELLEFKEKGPAREVCGYSVPRRTRYLDRWIRYGDWYPDRLVRLFRRDKGRFTGARVHERVAVDGAVLPLDGELLHFSYRDLEDHVRRSRHYARLWAQSRRDEGRTAGILDGPFHAAHRWLRGYLFRGGFLDGRAGWHVARLAAAETALKYRMLRGESSYQ